MCACVFGLVMVIYVVSFNCKSRCPFSTGELTNPGCLKESMCVSVGEINKTSGKCLSDKWRTPVCVTEEEGVFTCRP